MNKEMKEYYKNMFNVIETTKDEKALNEARNTFFNFIDEIDRLEEENNKKLDRLINLEEKILDYQGRLSLIKNHIKSLDKLCKEDGCSFVNLIEVIKILDMIKEGNNE